MKVKEKFILPKNMFKKKENGKQVFYFEISDNGIKKTIDLGNNYAVALARYDQLSFEDFDNQKEFTQICCRYFDEIVKYKAPRTQIDNRNEIMNLINFFSGMLINDIKPVNIAQYLASRKAKIRANREIALLSHIYNTARGWGYTDLENPCRGIRRNKELARGVYVTDDLFERLYNASNQRLKNALKMAYYTAQRPADVLKMRWEDIYANDGRRFLFVKQNKTGKKLSIEISGEFAFFIDSISKSKDGFILGLTECQLKYHFCKARKNACIKPFEFQFRDLRAKKGTDLFNKFGLEKAKELLGHASERMTRAYIRNERGDIVST